MPTALIATKLYIPRVRPELVPRPRLLHALNSGLERGLTLVSAPAGFGKTTLLSAWIKTLEQATSWARPACWLSLDRGDNDPARFWAYFVAALQTRHAGLGAAMLGALQPLQPASLETLVSGLVNEIADLEGGPVVVLDDYHAITNQQVHDSVEFLLHHLPPKMHLVIATRADPPWPLARLRARNQMMELRANELRFTPDEATAFLNSAMGLQLSAAYVAALEERTEGWIAGLQMAGLSLQGRMRTQGDHDPAAFVSAFTGSNRFVADYLVQEVLDQQTPVIQEFLLRTSVLERMNAPLCDAVTGSSDSQSMLAYLETANLFVVPLDDERHWYRYHQLFANLLRTRLEQGQPGLAGGLHHRASEWFEGAGLVDEAISHALADRAGSMERAADLVERFAFQTIVETRVALLSDWLEALPDELVRRRPWLCVHHAWLGHWRGERDQVEEYLQATEQALADMSLPVVSQEGTGHLPILTPAEQQDMAGHIAAIRAGHALTSGDIPRVLEMSQRALDLLPDGDYMRGSVALAMGGAYSGLGDVAAAQRAFESAKSNALRTGHPSWAVPTTCYIGIEQTRQGLLSEAHKTYEEALQLALGPDGRPLPVAGFPNVRIGDLFREWNNLDAARRLLETGVEQCLQLGQADVLADAYVALARLQWTLGDTGKAESTLRKADQVTQKTKVDPFVACWLDDCRLRIWLSAGNIGEAVQWAKTSGLSLDGELSYHYDLHHINLARVLVAQGQREPSGAHLDQALTLLARLLAAARKAGWVHAQIKILILQALAFQARGDQEEALGALARALSLAEPGGYMRVFLDEGAPMAVLLRHAVGRGIAAGYAGKLLAGFADSSQAIAVGPDASRPEGSGAPAGLLDPLSGREMEVLRLLATGLSSTEIAGELIVSVNTIRSHVKSIYGKLDVHGRMEAVQQARKLGLM